MKHSKNSNYDLKSYMIHLCVDYKLFLFSLFILAFFIGAFNILVQHQIKEIIDQIANNPKELNLLWLIGIFMLYKFLFHGMYFINRLLNIKYNPLLIERTVTDMYQKTTGHSLHWFDSHLSGEISSKISDFEQSNHILIHSCFRALTQVITVCMSLFFLIQINHIPALVLGIFILIYIPILAFLLKKQMKLQQKSTDARQKSIGIVNDSIANIFGVKIIGNVFSEFQTKLKPALLDWKKWDKKTRIFDAWWVDNADTIMITLMTGIQIYLTAYLYQNDFISVGEFTFISMITLNIHGELDKFLDSLLFHINPAIAKLKTSYSFLNEAYDIQNPVNPKSMNEVKGNIQYQNVSFTYDENQHPILQHFNLNIQSGERLGIVGTSGAGKTTLIKCLLRYFDIQHGKITIDNINIKDITQETLRKHISIIPQDISMFHRSILENIKLSKYDATDEEVITACKKAKIHDDILKMSKGYDSIVGERGVKVSGGQRQRIAIARAILKNAPILILDEATSSLDTPTEKLIQESIQNILENSHATVIAIAHRLSTVKYMDRIIVLEQGNIVEEGKHDTLIQKKDGFYKKLWDMQII